MRIADILIERTEVFPYRDYAGNELDLRLHWNPSPRQALNLISKTRAHQLRGLLVGDDLIVWDAYYVEHSDVEKLLGLNRAKRDVKIFLGMRDDDTPYISKKSIDHPQVQKFVKAGFALGMSLTERATRVDVRNGHDLVTTIVQQNPPVQVLTNFIEKSAWKNVRGLIDGQNIFWWDSSVATHEQMAQALGLPDCSNEDDPRRLVVYLQPDHSIYLGVNQKHRDHPQLHRLAQTTKVIFEDINSGLSLH